MSNRNMDAAAAAIACLLGAGTVGACHHASPAAAKMPPSQAEVRSAGKLQAPVEVAHALEGEAVPGRGMEVELTVTPLAPADDLVVEVTASEDLGLAVPLRRAFGPVKPGEAQRVRVPVVAGAEGRFYLDVVVILTAQGESVARAVSLPVPVGTGRGEAAKRQQQAAELPRDEAGRAMRRMPVVEDSVPR